MTEAEWLACEDPELMMEHLRGRVSDRKLQLFVVASFRLFLADALDPTPRASLWEAAESFADGESDRAALRRVWGDTGGGLAWPERAEDWAFGLVQEAPLYFRRPVGAEMTGIIRDLIGNPFRPVALNPAWLTPNVVDLARTIYDEREFPSGTLDRTRLAILADALLDAGCDSAEVLDHCRNEGPHVRGCWVIDLLLEKR